MAIQNRIKYLRVDNQAMQNNIDTMQAELNLLKEIVETQNVASGGSFGQLSQLNELTQSSGTPQTATTEATPSMQSSRPATTTFWYEDGKKQNCFDGFIF